MEFTVPALDEMLITQIANGDEGAFNQLYNRYCTSIYHYLLYMLEDRYGAEDVLQEVFIALWRGASGFRGRSKVKTWIFRIAYNQAISWQRRSSNYISYDDMVVYASETGLEEEVTSSLESEKIRNALGKLPDKHRVVVILAYLNDMSYSEIAEVLRIPLGTVKSRMNHAMRSLLRIMPIGDHVSFQRGKNE